jgi:extracellular factor (EF) 3-hydroxypalmitic acid methyl ester biosynthesis protein
VGLGFSETLCSRAVRYRKDLVKRQIKALLSRRAGSQGPVRVLSIGAGPAQELHELFQEMDDLPAPLEVVLFEQDKNALAHAFRRLTPSVEARFPGRVRLVFLHDSIKRLLRDGSLFSPFGKFDLVYSVGLLDYLQRRTAIVLTRHLAQAAAPGGQLLVANMVDHASRTLLQIHLVWALIYRSREELLEVARSAVPGAQIRILEEESGVNPFFELVHG